MKYLLFAIGFILLLHWHMISSSLKVLLASKKSTENIEILKNENLIKILKEKAGVKSLRSIQLYDKPKFVGLMIGLPGKPIMALSRQAYKELDNDTMEWLLLHEAAHYRLMHGLKILLFEFVIALLGLFTLSFLDGAVLIVIIPLITVLLVIITFQFMKRCERQANKFALKRIDNPQGVVDGGKYLVKLYYKESMYNTWYKKIYWRLFSVWEHYMHLEQIEAGQKEIERRKQNIKI